MNSVEDTAQTMFATQTVKGIVQQATSIIIYKSIYGNNGKNHNVVTETAQQSVQQKSNNVNELSSNIKLTGQFTDIAYADTDKITEKAISELCKDDEKLLNNVMDTYNNAVNDGLLKREWSKTTNDVIYTLTNKGKELVNSEAFIKQLEKNIRNALYNEKFKNTAAVEFTGTKDDVNVFRYVDSINIRAFDNHPALKKLFDLLKKYNFISVDENGNAKATNKLFTYFEQQDKKGIKPNFKISKVTADNMINVSEKIKKSQQAANAARKTAEVAKKAAETAAKAAKTTAKVAANGGAAAATGGTSLVVTAAVELSKKGLELLNSVGKQLESSKFHK